MESDAIFQEVERATLPPIPSTEATREATHQGAVSYETAAKILRVGFAVDLMPLLAELRENIARTVECGPHSHLIPNKTFVGRLIRSVELVPHSAPQPPDEDDSVQLDSLRDPGLRSEPEE